MKGTAWIWAGVVGMLVFSSFFWIIFNEQKANFEPTLTTELNDTNTTLANNSLNTYSYLSTTWQYFLFIMLFGVILWAFIQAQREKSPYE